MRQAKSLFKVIKEELILLDKRTDVLPIIMNNVRLNDDDWDDEWESDDYDDSMHLGVVSITLCGMTLISVWAIVSAMLILA